MEKTEKHEIWNGRIDSLSLPSPSYLVNGVGNDPKDIFERGKWITSLPSLPSDALVSLLESLLDIRG